MRFPKEHLRKKLLKPFGENSVEAIKLVNYWVKWFKKERQKQAELKSSQTVLRKHYVEA